MQTRNLDVFDLPLTGGEYFIEASAGTGKTSTIVLLYLRLLLGIGRQKDYNIAPLSVDKILVVTFTESATKELRWRIRSYIYELRLACMLGRSNNPLFFELFDLIDDKKNAIRQLLAAERKINEAAIYTIHGFCHRMLNKHAFESNILFHQILLQDELPIRRQACADFWRLYCYPLPFSIAAAITQDWEGPHKLLSDLQPYLQGNLPELRHFIASNETLLQRHQKIIERINTIKKHWLEAVYDIKSLITDSGVDNRHYNNVFLSKWLTVISEWAKTDTYDYQLPEVLRRFGQAILLEKTKRDYPPYHELFIAIDNLLADPSLSLRDLFFFRALSEVRKIIQLDKKQHVQLGFDDLLSYLYNALCKPSGNMLSESIRQCYPVAIVDEFQDTDFQQYGIFKSVYGEQLQYSLFLIGDPKQAIYSFRGADIFTYMHARREIKYHYTLDTNWRSSPGMVSSVNQLFSTTVPPFIFMDIPFLPVFCAKENYVLNFEIQGKLQPAMHIWMQTGKGCSIVEYHQSLASQCAKQIRDWLTAGQQGKALLYTKRKDSHGSAIVKWVKPSDITILVRSHNEAVLIRNALNKLSIPSLYLSKRDNVFKTQEAQDLFWLLQAVLDPEQKSFLRTALATNLIGMNAQQLDALNKEVHQWDALVDEFKNYREKWQNQGIFPMLRNIMVKRNIAENILSSLGGERSLTDLLHIGELLQEASITLYNAPLLLHWLGEQINKSDIASDKEHIRLENNSDLVQIMTIHKSKGLEFPIVWLPFIGSYRLEKKSFYHDREHFHAVLDLNYKDDSVKLAEEERLAEDLRLLYVALTRSIYHCSIGLAPLFLGKRKKQGKTDVHKSAIGYLIQQGEAGDAEMMLKCLKRLQNSNIILSTIKEQYDCPWVPLMEETKEMQDLQVKLFTRNMQDDWRITSYSGLQKHVSTQISDVLPAINLDFMTGSLEAQIKGFTIHTFPKGTSSGKFLHRLLERLDLIQPINITWLTEQVTQQGLSNEWVPVLKGWLELILCTPLAKEGMPCLSQLSLNQVQSELKFYLFIKNLISSDELDVLIKSYDPLSVQCSMLDFRQLHGILQGFIDLVFCWQGKYYVLDYKSNWLGDSSRAYTQEHILAAMVEHRYDFQYQIYSLALHRYLRQRLPNYQYEYHFGGVFYCFLRGMNPKKPQQGIFYYRPDVALIKGMDRFFGYT